MECWTACIAGALSWIVNRTGYFYIGECAGGTHNVLQNDADDCCLLGQQQLLWQEMNFREAGWKVQPAASAQPIGDRGHDWKSPCSATLGAELLCNAGACLQATSSLADVGSDDFDLHSRERISCEISQDCVNCDWDSLFSKCFKINQCVLEVFEAAKCGLSSCSHDARRHASMMTAHFHGNPRHPRHFKEFFISTSALKLQMHQPKELPTRATRAAKNAPDSITSSTMHQAHQ